VNFDEARVVNLPTRLCLQDYEAISVQLIAPVAGFMRVNELVASRPDARLLEGDRPARVALRVLRLGVTDVYGMRC